jgi:DNA-binding CsgD family transcriptional regulator
MSPERVTYQNWIVDLGRDPSQAPDPDQISPQATAPTTVSGAAGALESERQRLIREAVGLALSKLSDNERELIEQYHYMGRSYQEIAERSGRTIHRLESLHRRALRKLRAALAPLVKRLYGLGVSTDPDCPICTSPYRHEIDHLIRERQRFGTWRPIMRLLKSRFGLVIATPQTLIGHEKYH